VACYRVNYTFTFYPTAFVTSKREGGKQTSAAGMYPLYLLQNDTTMKDFNIFKLVVVFKKQLFWVVALCGWVNSSRRAVFIFRVVTP